MEIFEPMTSVTIDNIRLMYKENKQIKNVVLKFQIAKC